MIGPASYSASLVPPPSRSACCCCNCLKKQTIAALRSTKNRLISIVSFTGEGKIQNTWTEKGLKPPPITMATPEYRSERKASLALIKPACYTNYAKDYV